MSNFTFLSEEQIFERDRLSVIEKRGTKAAITDFAILLGGYVTDNYHVEGKSGLEDRTGWYWTRSDDGDNDACAAAYDGGRYNNDVTLRAVASRPASPFSSIAQIPTNFVPGSRARDGIMEVEYGYYPQKAVPKTMQMRLETAYQRGNIQKTQNSYTVDTVRCDDYNIRFSPQKYEEYELSGKRYVRIIANSCFDGNAFTLSNGEQYKGNDVVWIEVEPIKWLVDEKAKLMITEKLVFAGVQFNKERNYKTQNFGKTDIKKFMDTCFAKEIVQNRGLEQTRGAQQESLESDELQGVGTTRKKNPYDFKFNEVSEEEIIKGAVQSNVAVFLHGRSSEGKSARVKQIDPDCEIIYLRNATPESLNGKSVYNSVTGEMIDVKPTWLQKLEAKCEKEPEKIHVLFFDEITNALHSIQGMAFNIVLDGEVNGKWKLPENARIVAAGNDISDSLVANTLAEPLFNRFAHVYIETTTASWLKWAASPRETYQRLDYEKEEEPEMRIHPSIYAYIAYKSVNGEDVLRTEYNGEKPNADPRKWEMASKILYATKQPEMLRALIGEDLTRDFVAFCQQQVITVDDVINRRYTRQDLEMNLAERFATAVGLSSVDEKNLETVRNFVARLGGEIRGTFDNLWIHGDENRAERIAELQIKDLSYVSRNTGMDR